MDSHLVMELITVPLFTGTIGYITNWTGVLMLFETLDFRGFRMPGLKTLFPFFPRRIQVLPIFKDGEKLGWQGMVPSRAEKMASLAIDRSLAKVGNIGDFYAQLDPDAIAEHFVEVARPEIPRLVDRLMTQENPRLWNSLPDFAKEFVYRKVDEDLPKNAARINEEFVAHLDELVDAKSMAISFLVSHPKLLNDVFREFGEKELKFMVNFGAYFGYPMGFTLVAVLQVLPHWWVLPVGGAILGWVVNYLGITIIFEPVHRSRWVPWRQGLMLKRRPEVIVGYAGIISTHVMTLDNIMNELLHGPRSDRTLLMLDKVMRETVDSAVGRARILVRTAVGADQYERLKAAIAPAAMEMIPQVSADDEFVVAQRGKIDLFVQDQMTKLSLEDFQSILRGAVKQDEWLLFLHGGILGGLAGFLHLAIFGV
ncbi:DUF445 domain-containing protein [Antrihabitans sp. YC2-6]|uniref:DUF445 domain-containing protein n=1 Tax=Antrihabitans sp. YC2-6 TaxID=2799498 RepID=UPI0018F2E592|nr:hypothetical protein [Antrihabitans sp. YC2-6]MBJ8346498.1 hypothetical protein [Antrihabitans sp. YC2-6]